jgi:hypothetical protein
MSSWYTWAFDGVAGAAVVAIGIALYQRYTSKPHHVSEGHTVTVSKNSPISIDSPVSADMSSPITDSLVAVGSNINQTWEVHHHHSEAEQAEKWTPTEPNPIQILLEIDAALPYDRKHAKEKYKDLQVVWETSILTVQAENGGLSVGTVFRQPGEQVLRSLVDFRISSPTAELKSATSGSVVLIRGTIKSVLGWAFGIDLKPDPEIRFVKRLPHPTLEGQRPTALPNERAQDRAYQTSISKSRYLRISSKSARFDVITLAPLLRAVSAISTSK